MSRLLLFFGLTLLLQGSIWAQLKIDDAISPQEAMQRLVGQGVRVLNVSINCPSNKDRPFGYFTDNTGSLGLSEGLLLTTGSAKNAIGPNNSAAKSQSNGNKNQDADLKSIITGDEKQSDACVLECDIEVFADTLVFDYVFGSEEYLEFIKDYHDVFGFFISGPGISGTKNLALVPETNLSVSVLNINNNTNQKYFIDNGTGATPFDHLFVQYDGFTRKLEARIAVIPCQTYHLKMAICDVKDDIYDAGIFIGGKSLKTKAPKLSKKFQYATFRTTIEGCNGVNVTLTRQSRLDQPETYFLQYGGTASPILDYGPVPGSLDFLAGESSKTFFISILDDALDDDNETITISVRNPCPGLPAVDELIIPIRESFDLDVPDASLCLGDSVHLNPNFVNGYLWDWSPLQYLSGNLWNPLCKTPVNFAYQVIATEMQSGCRATDSLKVRVKPIPMAAFTYESRPDYTNLDVFFTNKSQFANAWQWDFGDGNGSNEENPRHYFQAGFGQDSTCFWVRLTAQNSAEGCADSDSAFICIENPFFIPNLLTVNGDNLNDTFKIRGIRSGYWQLDIFNRWGHQVFSSPTYNQDWKAENLESGTYFYILKNAPGDRQYTGWIWVVR